MTIEQEIVQTLKEFHPGKWVGDMYAIRKYDIIEGSQALKKLAGDGIIQRTTIGGLPHVRYLPPFREELKAVE